MNSLDYPSARRTAARSEILRQQREEATRRPASPDYIDLGLPIPESYGVDLLSVLAQSPYRLYAFWELSRQTWNSIERVFSPMGTPRPRVTLLLRDAEAGWQGRMEVGGATGWWLQVYPSRTYDVELGITLDDQTFIKLLGPRRKTSPAVSPRPAPEPESAAPFAPPRFENPPTAMAGIAGEIVGALGGEWPADSLETLLRLLHGGELRPEEVAGLPSDLVERLRSIASAAGEAALPAALLEYLADLGVELPSERFADSQRELPEVFVAPGSSEITVRPPLPRRWAPSLARKPDSTR